jgi:hypothetical protein
MFGNSQIIKYSGHLIKLETNFVIVGEVGLQSQGCDHNVKKTLRTN